LQAAASFLKSHASSSQQMLFVDYLSNRKAKMLRRSRYPVLSSCYRRFSLSLSSCLYALFQTAYRVLCESRSRKGVVHAHGRSVSTNDAAVFSRVHSFHKDNFGWGGLLAYHRVPDTDGKHHHLC